MLQDDPSLTPDEVKGRLMAWRPGLFRLPTRGGIVGASDAVQPAVGSTNQGITVDRYLAGTEHYGRCANRGENGETYSTELDSYAWGAVTMSINVWVPQE